LTSGYKKLSRRNSHHIINLLDMKIPQNIPIQPLISREQESTVISFSHNWHINFS